MAFHASMTEAPQRRAKLLYLVRKTSGSGLPRHRPKYSKPSSISLHASKKRLRAGVQPGHCDSMYAMNLSRPWGTVASSSRPFSLSTITRKASGMGSHSTSIPSSSNRCPSRPRATFTEIRDLMKCGFNSKRPRRNWWRNRRKVMLFYNQCLETHQRCAACSHQAAVAGAHRQDHTS